MVFHPAQIVLNDDSNGPFALDSDLGRGQTLIHELLHAFSDLLGSSGIPNNSPAADPYFPALSVANSKTVMGKCK